MSSYVLSQDSKASPIRLCLPITQQYGGPAPLPPPTSTRRESRKNNIYHFLAFISSTFNLPKLSLTQLPVLDIAGGKGDLSWLLQNIHTVHSCVIDPHNTNHKHLEKSLSFLLAHPAECSLRKIVTESTHQPLALYVDKIPARLVTPKHLRIHLTADIIATLHDPEKWGMAFTRESSLSPPTANEIRSPESTNRITSPSLARTTLLSAGLILGFHPDAATEPAIDLALRLTIPFAIVPCCVTPHLFPSRPVKTHEEFVDYLQAKHVRMRKAVIALNKESAKNVVLFMREDDYITEIT